jgi:ribulose-5-phosphate 4-epimerase/fuculose-1-phosphate aldolase
MPATLSPVFANAPKTIDCSDAEWACRLQLAAAYRIFAYLGWTELIYNHITLRIPGPEKHLLINPFGLMYSEICASNLVKIDLQGNLVGPSDWPANPAGFTTHGAIHTHVPDAHCVMHTHTTAGLAVACSSQGLSMNNFYSAQLLDMVAYHDFEGITVYADEGPRLIANLQGKPALILRNHGLLAWGNTVPRALATLWLLNRACEVQLATSALGPSIPLSLEVQRKCTADSFHFKADYGAGQDVFDALIRMIDRVDPDYRR